MAAADYGIPRLLSWLMASFNATLRAISSGLVFFLPGVGGLSRWNLIPSNACGFFTSKYGSICSSANAAFSPATLHDLHAAHRGPTRFSLMQPPNRFRSILNGASVLVCTALIFSKYWFPEPCLPIDTHPSPSKNPAAQITASGLLISESSGNAGSVPMTSNENLSSNGLPRIERDKCNVQNPRERRRLEHSGTTQYCIGLDINGVYHA